MGFNYNTEMMDSPLKNKVASCLISALILTITSTSGCQGSNFTSRETRTVPGAGEWGIYKLDLATMDVTLVYSAPGEIQSSALRLNGAGDRFLFARKVGSGDNDVEIFSMNTDGSNLRRLTDNSFWDLYPAWSPDGEYIAFLSKRERDLDIYLMDADGANVRKLYDSGDNDADIDWAGDSIVFTAQSAIWRMKGDGTQATRVTDPPGAGEWGKANLPKGDYDPRLTRDGKRIVFERLEDVSNPYGGYNFFAINLDGKGETRLTDNGYSQGLANWSHSGDRLVYTVAAIGNAGEYDMYTMNSDGTNNRNITPAYFPANFLCHSPVFSSNDASIFFIGQRWK